MDKERVSEYIKQMYSVKPLYSNYFYQPLDLDDFYRKTAHTLLIIKPENAYNRIYILSDNAEDAIRELNLLNGISVINVPSKGNVKQWEQLMLQTGFKLIGVYERFYNVKIQPIEESEPIIYAEVHQEKEIYDLFYNSGFFSLYTDYLPSHKELEQLIENKNVIVNVSDKQIKGAFLFSIEKQKGYFRAWIDKSSNRLKLLFDAYTIMVSKNINYVYFWVNSENKKVRSIHQLLGAKPDGLKDYTFIKQ
jgi:hypothetical protein